MNLKSGLVGVVSPCSFMNYMISIRSNLRVYGSVTLML